MAAFYIYGTFKEHAETLPRDRFSFLVDEHQDVVVPSFLIWLNADKDGEALLGKIRRTTRPADIGMAIHVYDVTSIQISASGILNSVSPIRPPGTTGREIADTIVSMRALLPVPDDKTALVQNALLKSNRGRIDESYFHFGTSEGHPEVLVQSSDAIHTAFRIFGLPIPMLSPLREQQILDFDIETLFPPDVERTPTPDGRHFFEHAGKRLYIHKVDRTPIEECLGVDLVYNFLDDQRLVFVQYKCQRARGRYYPSSDRNHDDEVRRMETIPGLAECYNLGRRGPAQARLCSCPVFVKLCRRDVPETHSVPKGVYVPLCVWKGHVSERKSLSVEQQPHLNNSHFKDLVRCGFIGSTREQSVQIERHLIRESQDSRMKLVFEEEIIGA